MSPSTAAAGGAVGLVVLIIVARLWPVPRPVLGVNRGMSLLAGLAAGLGAMAAIELAPVLLRAARLAPAPRGPVLAWGAAWAFTALVVAAAQEGWLRGWLLARMAASWGFRRAALATSGLFVLLHAGPRVLVLPPGVILLGGVGLFLFGLVAAASVRRTGSIAWAVGAHAGWDYVQGFVLGAPAYGVSPEAGSILLVQPRGPWGWLAGEAFGPEASPLAILVLAASLWAWLCVRASQGSRH